MVSSGGTGASMASKEAASDVIGEGGGGTKANADLRRRRCCGRSELLLGNEYLRYPC